MSLRVPSYKLYTTPGEWKHSEIITLSLRINARPNEYEPVCVYARGKEGGEDDS